MKKKMCAMTRRAQFLGAQFLGAQFWRNSLTPSPPPPQVLQHADQDAQAEHVERDQEDDRGAAGEGLSDQPQPQRAAPPEEGCRARAARARGAAGAEGGADGGVGRDATAARQAEGAGRGDRAQNRRDCARRRPERRREAGRVRDLSDVDLPADGGARDGREHPAGGRQAERRVVLELRRPRQLALPPRRVLGVQDQRAAGDAGDEDPQPLPAQPLRGAAREYGEHERPRLQAFARVPLLRRAPAAAWRADAGDGGGLPPRCRVRGVARRRRRPPIKLGRAVRHAEIAAGRRRAHRRRAHRPRRRPPGRASGAGAAGEAADHEGVPREMRAGEGARRARGARPRLARRPRLGRRVGRRRRRQAPAAARTRLRRLLIGVPAGGRRRQAAAVVHLRPRVGIARVSRRVRLLTPAPARRARALRRSARRARRGPRPRRRRRQGRRPRAAGLAVAVTCRRRKRSISPT